VSSGFQAYSVPDFPRSPLLRARQHDLRGCVQVTVVNIVDVVIVPDCGVAAVRTMLMGMIGMMFLGASHDFFSLGR
jgi:hypothetical protein